ncbi:hypothetical protein CTA1_5424 [Colletotrichum tanaceti]|uniref:Uncharacterized protein n=1 Tax=Colletotrichum tanaceti TaxID=1306861 RepID=A0A4U6WZQ5_9PEZI|nr:hypothetical protein CTA1_5424 [Colletotrichum tanaceti]
MTAAEASDVDEAVDMDTFFDGTLGHGLEENSSSWRFSSRTGGGSEVGLAES